MHIGNNSGGHAPVDVFLERDEIWQNRGIPEFSGNLIQHRCWDGGQHGWQSLYLWICVSERFRVLKLAGASALWQHR